VDAPRVTLCCQEEGKLMNQAPIALVVEDDAATRHLLRHILEKEGYSVKAVDDGRAAERLIEAEPAPAIVTLDCLLPYADGFELLDKIQRTRGWEDVPVIMLSTNSQRRHVARALDSGASDYIVKPFRLADLRATVRRLVNARDPVTSPREQFPYPFAPAYSHTPMAAMVPVAA
jgi:DNA-binding response OmpR family regulator